MCVTPQELAWLALPVRDVTVADAGLFMESTQVFPCSSVGRFSCSGLSLHLASRAKVHMGKSKGTCDICVMFDVTTAWGNERGRESGGLTVLRQKHEERPSLLSRDLFVH